MKNGGYFKFPNVVIDKLGSLLSGGEFKILCVIIRQTIGWHKQWDRISVSQFIEKTGLSKQGVIDCVNTLEAKKVILCEKKVGVATRYALFGETNKKAQPVHSVDRYTELTGQLIRQELVNSVDRLLVNSVDTQKKRFKETKNNNDSLPSEPENENDERFDKICDAFKKAIGGNPGAITLVSNSYQLEAFNAVMEYSDEKILTVIRVSGEKGKLHQDNAVSYVLTGLKNFGQYYGGGNGGVAGSELDKQREDAKLKLMKQDEANFRKQGMIELADRMVIAIAEAEGR
jgi:phage replication O-like protein O